MKCITHTLNFSGEIGGLESEIEEAESRFSKFIFIKYENYNNATIKQMFLKKIYLSQSRFIKVLRSFLTFSDLFL